MRVRVKICGMTRHEDALLAAKLGADAIGLIFYEKSPRVLTPAQAQQVIAGLPPYVSKVAVFVNAPKETVEAISSLLKIDYLQFHGDETPQYCDSFVYPYIKVARMQADLDLLAFAKRYPNASGFLLDTHEQGRRGGTGKVFDWNLIPKDMSCPIILSGGLTTENIQDAIQRVRPYAVDISSGVERSPGIKDAHKLREFFTLIEHEGV